ncbi:MAG: hypothetical protein QNI99_02940 [Woeseiaceae bacterium]|nr:hypothetical protein [Woeseiaceae bacterium]
MNKKRRLILKTAGSALLITAAGGVWWGATRTSTSAREPWARVTEGFGDVRLNVLAYAILAPNPHNMQPWQVRLDEALAFSVFCNPDRLLPETDPPSRQITIGFGCFLELARQAAAESGYRAEIEYYPEGEHGEAIDDRPIAKVVLVEDPDVVRDPLFATALTRRTNRFGYDTDRQVDAAALESIIFATVPGVMAGATGDPSKVEELRQLTVDAWQTEWSNAPTRRESIHVTRFGKQEVTDAPWGITLDGAFNSALVATGMLSREGMDDPETAAYRESAAFYEAGCRSAMAFAWSTTATNTRRDQLEAGRAWIRMQQTATESGLAFQPLSQALQEFPAMATHYERAHEMLAPADGHTVQMLARLGYARDVGPSPREPLESKLIVA